MHSANYSPPSLSHTSFSMIACKNNLIVPRQEGDSSGRPRTMEESKQELVPWPAGLSSVSLRFQLEVMEVPLGMSGSNQLVLPAG